MENFQNVSDRYALEKALRVLVSRDAQGVMEMLYERFGDDPSTLVTHRFTVGFHVRKVLDLFSIKWPDDPTELNSVLLLLEAFGRMKRTGVGQRRPVEESPPGDGRCGDCSA